MKPQFNFETPKSIARSAHILNRLALGDASSDEIGVTIGCSRGTTRAFLAHLTDIGKVIRKSPFIRRFGGREPCVYGLPIYADVPALPHGLTVEVIEFCEGDTRKVTISKSWPPMEVQKQSIFAPLGL